MSSRAPATPPRRFDPKTLLQLTLFGLLALIWLGLALATDTFFTEQNISNLVRQTSIGALVAFGQTFVIITAGIDLSVGAVVGLSGVVLALLNGAGVPFPVAVVLTLLLGTLIGIYHGFGVHNLGLPPFIMTLASLVGLRGVALLITNGQSIGGLPRAFSDFSQATLWRIPSLFWIVIIVGVLTYVLLQRSRFGRYIYAVGSNLEAARLSGVNIGRTIYLAYAVSSTLAALAGILLASRISIGIPTAGTYYELDAIAASVIGGASLFGAEGSIIGSFVGALLLTTINNGSNLLGVNPFWQPIITGLIIVGVVYTDQLRKRRQ